MVLKKNIKKLLLNTIYVIMLLPVCAEVALRIMGYAPYKMQSYNIKCEPAGMFQGDSLLGLKLKPGSFEVTHDKELKFQAIHNEEGYRLVKRNSDSVEREIHFYGCSFTYGYGVNDSSTFVQRIQDSLKSYHCFNYGIPGYGTVQSLLCLENNVGKGKIPDEVFLIFSKFHFERNPLLNTYRRALKVGFENSLGENQKQFLGAKLPYSNEQGEIRWQDWSEMYSDWKGRTYFSLVNFLQTSSEIGIDRRVKETPTTINVIEKFNQLCQAHNIKCNVVCLDLSPRISYMIGDLELMGVNVIQIGFDFKNNNIINYPHDTHPNDKGHRIIANKIMNYINS